MFPLITSSSLLFLYVITGYPSISSGAYEGNDVTHVMTKLHKKFPAIIKLHIIMLQEVWLVDIHKVLWSDEKHLVNCFFLCAKLVHSYRIEEKLITYKFSFVIIIA